MAVGLCLFSKYVRFAKFIIETKISVAIGAFLRNARVPLIYKDGLLISEETLYLQVRHPFERFEPCCDWKAGFASPSWCYDTAIKSPQALSEASFLSSSSHDVDELASEQHSYVSV